MSDAIAMSYGESRIELAKLRALRAVARAADQDAVPIEREIAMERQRVAALSQEPALLPSFRLRRELSLTELEDDIIWLVASRHPIFQTTAEKPAELPPLTPVFAAEVLADTRPERMKVHQALARDGRLARLGLLRLVRAPGPSDRRVDVLQTPGFLPWWLAGQRVVSDELAPFVSRIAPAMQLDLVALKPTQRAALKHALEFLKEDRSAQQDARTQPSGYDFQRGGLVVITGPRGAGKTIVGKALAASQRRHVLVADGALLALLPVADQGWILDVLLAEAAVTREPILFDRIDLVFQEPPPDSHQEPRYIYARFERLLQRFPVTVIATAETAGRVSSSLRDRAFFSIELPPVTRELGAQIWQRNAPTGFVLAPDASIEDIASKYSLSGRGIQNALNLLLRSEGGVVTRAALELACQSQQNSGMSETTTRVWIRRERGDLELPTHLARQIDEIIRTEAIRESTLESWGLQQRLHKGLGLVCLFDGEPGTGKTLAAEVIASELDLPLYSVNVANVMSKWIGETEKNLFRVFEDAARNRCVLLFDEADSLFSKRTSVERAVDRFSNMEINLLLQLIESYRGLVLLTTNLKDSIDPAFARRFAFKLSFEFPDALVRERIWRRILPADKLAADVDLGILARAYELAGGAIRNVVLRAAYRAASERRLIDQAILEDCSVNECRALGKLVRER